MSQRKKTPVYILFYILFSPETWRLVAGILAAGLLTPLVSGPEHGPGARVILFVMLTTIGYASSGRAARWISGRLIRWLTPGARSFRPHSRSSDHRKR